MTPAPITPPPPPQIPHAELVRRIERMTAVDAHPHYTAHAAILSRMGRMTPIEGKRCE